VFGVLFTVPQAHSVPPISPGDLIVTDLSVPGVFRQSPSGGAPTTIFSGAPYVVPAGVVVDASGNIIVADKGADAVFRQNPSGGVPTVIHSGAPYILPADVAIEASGNIIVSDAIAAAVFRQSPSGGVPTAIYSGAPYVQPRFVAIVPLTLPVCFGLTALQCAIVQGGYRDAPASLRVDTKDKG
jgi:hypothetical protein